MNPQIPTKFRYDAAALIDDDNDNNYQRTVFYEIAKNATADINYRIFALRELKDNSDLATVIVEQWIIQQNEDSNWELFEDLYRPESDGYGSPYEEEQTTTQLEIIQIIINNITLDKNFLKRVINEKLKDHH